MKFLLSFAEQCFGSITTLSINLWLIRNGAAQSYGLYVFWLSIAYVLGTAQGTLVIAHLLALPSARDHAEKRLGPERLFFSVSLVVILAAMLCAFAGNLALRIMGSPLATPAAALFIGAFLFFQYVRAFAFSRQQPFLAACLSAGILLSCVVLLPLDKLLGHAPTADRVLVLTAVAYGAISAVILFVLAGAIKPLLRLSEIRPHAHHLHGSGWLMLGAGSGEITNRLYSFTVVGRFGTEALAALSAVQVVIRPAWMLSAAWSSIGFPQLSARRAEGDWRGFERSVLLGAAAATSGSLIWTIIVIVAWPFVSGTVYGGRYPDIGILGYLWGINVMAGSMSVAFNTALLALGERKRLAIVDLCGAIVTIIALGGVVAELPYPFSIAATVLGQTTQIVLMAALVQRRLRFLKANDRRGAPMPKANAGAGSNAISPDPALPT